MRFFNTTGPVVEADHYCIPPLERLDLTEVRRLIRDKRYFVLHAPRQTGKTSALLALRDLLNTEGDYRCVYVNVEGGQAGREDVEHVMRTFLGELASRASLTQTIADGLDQTAESMDRCDAEAGHLVIFDRREGRRWADKVFYDRRTSSNGVDIDIWGM